MSLSFPDPSIPITKPNGLMEDAFNLFLLQLRETLNNYSIIPVLTKRIISTDSPYTLLTTDNRLYCDTDGGAIIINLLAGEDGQSFKIINTGSSGNDVTLIPNGVELLIGVNSSEYLIDAETLMLTYEPTEGWW